MAYRRADALHPLARLQGVVGNRVLRSRIPGPSSRRISRKAEEPGHLDAGPATSSEAAPDAASIIWRDYPHLARVLTEEQIARVQSILAARAAWERLAPRLQAYHAEVDAIARGHQRVYGGLPTGGQPDVRTPRWLFKGVDRRYRGVLRERDRLGDFLRGDGSKPLVVPTFPLLSADILAPQPFNTRDEARFRSRLVKKLSHHPVHLYVGSGTARDPLFRLSWDGRPLPHEGGLVRFQDLMQDVRIDQEYYSEVKSGPTVDELRGHLKTLTEAVADGRRHHWAVSELRKEGGAVAKASDVMGGLVTLPGLDIWLDAELALDSARRELDYWPGYGPDSRPRAEPAAAHMVRAARLYEANMVAVYGYEKGTYAGAIRWVKGLEAVKVGSAITVTVLSGGVAWKYGVLTSSAAAGGAAGANRFLQGAAQRGSEVGLGLRDDMDFASLVGSGLREGVTVFVGTLIAGGFARQFERLFAAVGFGGVGGSVAADVAGGVTAAPITTAGETLLGGEGFHGYWDRVIDAAVEGAILDMFMGGIGRFVGPGWTRAGGEADLRTGDLTRLAPQEQGFLLKTSIRDADDLSLSAALRELEIAERGDFPRREISEGDYVEAVELPNGHTWKRTQEGRWCRFSKRPFCIFFGETPARGLMGPESELVWLTESTKKYHSRDSPYYGRTRGRLISRAEAEAAGYTRAKVGEGLRAAREGVLKHAAYAEAQRPWVDVLSRDGWELAGVETRVGGTKRVDEWWVNHRTKRILVIDLYTGRVESEAHYRKGWAYANEAHILELIELGYQYEYQVGIWHSDALH